MFIQKVTKIKSIPLTRMGLYNKMGAFGSLLIIDIRSEAAYRAGHVPRAINLPLSASDIEQDEQTQPLDLAQLSRRLSTKDALAFKRRLRANIIIYSDYSDSDSDLTRNPSPSPSPAQIESEPAQTTEHPLPDSQTEKGNEKEKEKEMIEVVRDEDVNKQVALTPVALSTLDPPGASVSSASTESELHKDKSNHHHHHNNNNNNPGIVISGTPTLRTESGPGSDHTQTHTHIEVERESVKQLDDQKEAKTVDIGTGESLDEVANGLMGYLSDLLATEGRVHQIYLLQDGYERFHESYPFLRCSYSPTNSSTPSLNSPTNPTNPNENSSENTSTITTMKSVTRLSQIAQHNHIPPFPWYPSEIWEGLLYLGDHTHANNLSHLTHLGIKRVLNISSELENAFPDSLTYLRFNLPDDPDQDITSVFLPAFDFLDQSLDNHQPVLIHCYQGVSRSAAVLLAYLMVRRQWTLKQSYDYVKTSRPQINPNLGFWKQLAIFEVETLKKKMTRDHLDNDTCEHDLKTVESTVSECVDLGLMEEELKSQKNSKNKASVLKKGGKI